MEYVNVTSRSVFSMGYDSETSTMGVVFTNGAEYHYAGVPRETYDRVKNATSIGQALDLFVKKAGFKYTRVR